jgi:CRISPR-associated endonuclease Csn1
MIRRLAEFNGNAKEAFSDLDKNPIWLDKRNGVFIKSVRIKGVNNAGSLHEKNDHHGESILDSKGAKQNVDFVQFGNNHHVAIYQDSEGKLYEMVVSFFEAVRRTHAKEPVIDKLYNEHMGWKFLFTMKQNEMFIFPSEDFNPKEIDIMNPINYPEISKNIFRVQKITPGDYFFRHHLEAQLIDNSKSKGFTWKRLGLSGINRVIKVRINHLGKIMKVGEY